VSYDELEERGIFLPEEHWGESELTRPASPWLLAVLGSLAALACVAMVVGQGRVLTWLGCGAFIVLLWAFTFVTGRTIDRQNRRIEAAKQPSGDSVGSSAGSSAGDSAGGSGR